MRRLVVAGVIALLILATVPLVNAVVAPAPVAKAVDGTVMVTEKVGRTWLAKFEVRTTGSDVQFGYLEMYGTGGEVAGEIHQYSVYHVDYFTAASGALGATLLMKECIIVPSKPCFDVEYQVTDGSAVGQGDTFLANLGWVVTSGNVSIYPAPADNPPSRVGLAKVAAGHRYVDVDLRGKGGLGSDPRCFAELQTYRSGVSISAVRPNYPVTGKLRIYLNKAVSASTYVAWNVTNQR